MVKDISQPYRAGTSGDWVKVRQMTVLDAIVIGVTGPLERPHELVLARLDGGALRRIGLSLPLSPQLRDTAGAYVTSIGEPMARVSSGVFGRPSTEYQPVRPELVVEIEAEAAVVDFGSRLRPRVHRLRPELTLGDVDQPEGVRGRRPACLRVGLSRSSRARTGCARPPPRAGRS